MFKKTLIASAVTAVFALTSQGVQANPITDLVSGFVKDAATVQFDARRGGSRSFSRSSAPKRSVSSTRTAQKRPVADTKAPAQASRTLLMPHRLPQLAAWVWVVHSSPH